MRSEEAFFDADRRQRKQSLELLGFSARTVLVIAILQAATLFVLFFAAITLWRHRHGLAVAVEQQPISVVLVAPDAASPARVETFRAMQSFVSGSTHLCEPTKALCELDWIDGKKVRMTTTELAKHLEAQLESRELLIAVAGGHDLTELTPAATLQFGSNHNLAYLRSKQVIEWLTLKVPALERAHVIPVATGSSAPQRSVDRSAWITVVSLPRYK